MRKVMVGVAIGALLAGCTIQSPGSPPPPRSGPVLGDACGELGWGKVLGAAAGGAAGGLLVSNLAHGSGAGVATMAGVIGGLLLGGLVGSSVDKVDCQRARAAYQQALQPATPTGHAIQWNDPRSGASGSFTPTGEPAAAPDGYCRDFSQTITINGELKQGVGRACRQPDGTWRTVS